MTTVKDLVVALKAKSDGFDRRLSASQRRVEGFSRSASAGFAHVQRAALAMGAGIGLAFKSAIEDTVAFEGSFSRFAARTGADVGKLRDTYGRHVDDISILTGVAATEIVDAFQLAESAGASGQQAIELVTRAAKSQAAELAAASQAVDAATTVADKFAVSYTHGLNAITVASQLGKGGVEDFATAAKQTGPLAAALGVSLANTGAAIAEISLKGSGIVEGTTQLRAFLGALLKPTSQAEKALDALGKSLGLPNYDAKAVRDRIRAGGLVDVLREFKSLDVGQLGQILDRTAVEFVLAVDPDSIASLSRRVEDGLADATSRAFDQGAGDLDRHLDQLRARWEAATRSANDGLLDTFRDIQTRIEAGGGDMDAVFRSIASGLRTVATVMADVAVVAFEYRRLIGWIALGIGLVITASAAWHLLAHAWTVVLHLGKFLVTKLLPVLVQLVGFLATKALPALAQAFWGIATKVLPALVSPIAGIVAAIGVFAYLASVVVRAWEPVQAFFASLWEGIKAGAEVVWLSVRNTFQDLKDDLLGFLSGLGEKINLALAATPGIDYQLPTLTDVEKRQQVGDAAIRDNELRQAKAVFADALGGVGGTLGDAGEAIAGIVGEDVERVRSAWGSVVDGAGDLAGTALDVAGGLFDAKLLTPAKDLLAGLRSGFPSSPAEPDEYYAALGLPDRSHHLPTPTPPTPPPVPDVPDFEPVVTVADMEPPADTAAAALSDALRAAFRDGDLSDVGRNAWDAFRSAIVDNFLDRFERALGHVFDDDPKTGFLSTLLNFDSGGEVPGPAGKPRLAIVHGGEVVMTPRQRQGGVTVNQTVQYVGDFDENVLAALHRRSFEAAAILAT